MDRTRASIDTAYTWDGGRHWSQSLSTHVDECTGNCDQQWEAAGDPWITFRLDGTAYFSFLSWAHFDTPPLSSYVSVLHVVSSVDGGKKWSFPVGVGRQDYASDADMDLADRKIPGTVYAGWRNVGEGLPVGVRGANKLLFSKTTDFGKTWSAPKVVATLGAGASHVFINPQLVELPTGTLVYTTTIPTSTVGAELVAYRSTDHGDSWSSAIDIAALSSGAAPTICGHPFTDTDAGQTSVAGDTIVRVEIDGATQAQGRGKIILYWSKDGGLTWQNEPVVRSPVLVALATVTVDRRHRLAMVWDEINQNAADCNAYPTTIAPTVVKLFVSRDWESGHPTGSTIDLGATSFNLGSALIHTRYDLGDYQAYFPHIAGAISG